jgi:hypothetical protein
MQKPNKKGHEKRNGSPSLEQALTGLVSIIRTPHSPQRRLPWGCAHPFGSMNVP